MIILDTNVISTLMLSPADPRLLAFVDALPRHEVWTTAVTLHEIMYGIEVLSPSRRRDRLERTFAELERRVLSGRILALDDAAALASARLEAQRFLSGTNIDIRDTMIAGIALAHGASVATRNVRHFADVGVPIIDPWDS